MFDHGFDNDFESEYLVTNKYTASGKIAMHGISNGGKYRSHTPSFGCPRSGTGLLVCATVARAPEGLFGAVIAEYGVQDLLRVHVVNCSPLP